MDTTGIAEFKDFEEREEPIPFRVGSEMYAAVPAIGIGLIADITQYQDKLSGLGKVTDAEEAGRVVEGLQGMFGLLLTEESAGRFNQRLVSRDKPIGFRTVLNITNWLLECYGMRPTQPSAGSSVAGGDVTSSSSTAGQPATAPATGLDSPLGAS